MPWKLWREPLPQPDRTRRTAEIGRKAQDTLTEARNNGDVKKLESVVSHPHFEKQIDIIKMLKAPAFAGTFFPEDFSCIDLFHHQTVGSVGS